LAYLDYIHLHTHNTGYTALTSSISSRPQPNGRQPCCAASTMAVWMFDPSGFA